MWWNLLATPVAENIFTTGRECPDFIFNDLLLTAASTGMAPF